MKSTSFDTMQKKKKKKINDESPLLAAIGDEN